MSDSIDLANAERWLLMGSGGLISVVATTLTSYQIPFRIACGLRHLDEVVGANGQSFRRMLVEHQFPYWQVEDIHSDGRVLEWLERPCIGLSLGAPWVLRQNLISRFERRLFNSHGARLPRDRGAGGYSWRILRNDRLGYSVLHELTVGVDKGGVVKLKEYLFPANCRIPLHFQSYAREQDSKMLLALVEDARLGRSLEVTSQPEHLSTYWPRLHTQSNGAIDWRWTLREIEQFVNAFDQPFAGAFTLINSQRCHLRGCYATTDDGVFHPFQSGLVYRRSSIGLFVAVTDGSLIVTEVLDEQGGVITDQIRLGDRFYTPGDLLAKALCFRPQYSASGLQVGAANRPPGSSKDQP